MPNSIFNAVKEAMQEAEELGGPEGTDYIKLMQSIAEEAMKRIEVYRESQGEKMAGFCRQCGKELVLRYPGGDPENGPARFSCPNKEHESPSDAAYTQAVLMADKIVEMFPNCTEEQFNSVIILFMQMGGE